MLDGWIGDLVNGFINGVVNFITSASMAALDWVLDLLNNDVFHSPDMTRLPQVASVSGRALLAVNAAMTLAVVIVGLVAMTHGSLQDRHSLKQLLPRMVIGFALANLAGPIFRAVIAAGNAVTAALAGGSFTDKDSFDAIKRTVVDVTTDPAQFIMALVLRELALWMLVFVVVTWLGRLCVLLVVAATAPAALMCHAIPVAEPVAKAWWRSLGSCLAVQILQAVTLHMAVAAVLEPGVSAPVVLGLPHDPTGLFNLLLVCFLLWMVIRIPKYVARSFGGSTGRAGSVLGSIIRLVVVQQVLGAVGLRGRGRRPAGRRVGAATPPGARPPSPHFHQHTGAHQHLHMHVHPPRTTTPGGSGRAPYRAGDVSPPRSAAGRPPVALQHRPALPPAGGARRAIGPARP